MEVDITGSNPATYPEIATWDWPVAAYLFLGGLVGGLMILVAILRLRRRGFERAVRIADLWALPLLMAGLALLFLDLSYKVHAWRFFTTFRVTSAMSWGSWILVAAAALLVLRLSVHLPTTRWMEGGRAPARVEWVMSALGSRVIPHTRGLDAITITIGVALAFYTGILLSSIPARPLWDSIALAPLFLVSGVAAAGAFVCLFLSPQDHRRLTPAAMALCGGELLLIGALFLTLNLGTEAAGRAAGTLAGWSFGLLFWGVVVGAGLLTPLAIEAAEMRRLSVPPLISKTAPILKLVGSAVLRLVIVVAGLQTAI